MPNGAIVAAVFAVVAVVVCLGCILCIRRRRRKSRPVVQATTSQEYESLPPVDTRDPTPSPLYEKRYDIENPAPAYLGKLKDLHLVPSRLKTLQLLNRTISTYSSASTLVESKNDKPEICLDRAYTLQPPIPNPDVYFNPHYLSTRRVSNGTTHTSVILDGVDALAYSPDEGRQSSRTPFRFGRFSRIWGARSSVVSADRMTVFDASHHTTSPEDPHSARSPPTGTVKSPPTDRRTSQLLPNLRRGSLRSYQRVSSGESPTNAVTRFAPIEDVPEESSYYPTPLAPPPAAKIKSRVTAQVRHGLTLNTNGTTANRPMSTEDRASENRTDASGVPTLPGVSILASAMAKGKVTREEAESALGMPLR